MDVHFTFTSVTQSPFYKIDGGCTDLPNNPVGFTQYFSDTRRSSTFVSFLAFFLPLKIKLDLNSRSICPVILLLNL